ncbi:RDD family protein [Pontibacter pudoricolor]|uniref:RDD family protein n=1 Tax=Pontibacter pudoricolor TaxID=2694930 RepID=UPI001390B2E5|nr:RDD family protein [Pontibacter pudoricolor]
MQAIYLKSGERVVPASLRMRAIAFIIDAVLIVTIAAIADYYTVSSNEATFVWKPETLIYIVLGWLYFAGAETSAVQATLGKYLLGLQVVDKHNNRLTFKNATIRYFARPLSIMIMLMRFVRGLPVAKHRYFHNRVTDSNVVKQARHHT